MMINSVRIATVHDEYGPIYVYQNRISRILSFDGDIEQGCMSLSNPAELMHQYTQAMMTGFLFLSRTETATIMGLGTGSMAKCLLNSFDELSVHAIELRQEVINTARKFFHLPNDRRLHIHTSDAVSYMKTTKTKSDIIFSDLYNTHGMEPRQIQLSYLRRCKKSLTEEGVLVLNLWLQDFRSTAEIEDLLSHVFENRLISFTVEGGNTIVIAFKNDIPSIKHKELLHRAKTIQQQMNVPVARYAKLIWNQQQYKFGID
ncbi:MAG: ATP-binding protein [Gammaproteobacteria bacterium]|nr:ATP-binding protein [Gammaproteobacteria bacterium]